MRRLGASALPFLLAGSLLAQDPNGDFVRAREPEAKSGPMGTALERLDTVRGAWAPGAWARRCTTSRIS